MHDSLLDLADALGGSTVSVEEHSTEDIDLPLNGTSELPKSGEGRYLAVSLLIRFVVKPLVLSLSVCLSVCVV